MACLVCVIRRRITHFAQTNHCYVRSRLALFLMPQFSLAAEDHIAEAAVFQDMMTLVVRTARDGERELTMMRWGFPPPPNLGNAPGMDTRQAWAANGPDSPPE